MTRASLRRRIRACSRASGDESGYTLVELLVVLVVLPMLIGAVATAFIEVVDQQGSVAKSLSDSADEQVVSANFVQDVQSAQYFTTDPAPTSITMAQPNNASAPSLCGPVASSTVTPLLGLEWGGFSDSLTTTTTTVAGQAAPEVYQTVVFYDSVEQPLTAGQTANTYYLVRYECDNGASSNSANYSSSNVSTNFSPQSAVTVNPSTVTGYSTSWIAVSTPAYNVTSIQLAVQEGAQTSSLLSGGGADLQQPGGYTFTLNGVPANASRQGGTTSSNTVSAPGFSTTCGFASANTGSLAQTLCFVDFTGFNWTTANSSKTSCPKVNSQSVTGQWVSAAITGTPYYLSFCVTASGGQAGAVPLPTYYAPSASGYSSEAYLGNNGFYTGVPGQPALYQCDGTYNSRGSTETVDGDSVGWTGTTVGVGNEIASTCTQTANATTTTLVFSDVQVVDGNGNAAQGWELVSGDAESTDANEWIAWTTCPSFQNASSPVSPGPSTQLVGSSCTNSGKGTVTTSSNQITNVMSSTGYLDGMAITGNGIPAGTIITGVSGTTLTLSNSATASGTGVAITGTDPGFQLLDNSSTSEFGNTCNWSGVSNPSSSLIPNGYFIEPALYSGDPTTQNAVECAENIQIDKTGTLMLEALQPSTMAVEMQGAGLQGIFLGVLLP